MRKRWPLLLAFFLVPAMACTISTPRRGDATATFEAAVQATLTALAGTPPAASPPGTPSPPAAPATSPATQPPSTAIAQATATPGCTYDAAFVADITIPDDTELAPGTSFVKVWRVRNSGTCDWDEGFTWVFDAGDRMGGPASVSVPSTAAGSTVDLSVALVAPDEPGTYTGYWQMQTPTGQRFGTRMFVRIQVVAAPEPTATPTPTPPPGEPPTIAYFRADVTEADPGDTITLEWESSGGVRAVLYHLMPTGQLGNSWEVSVTGSMSYTIPTEARNQEQFVLFVFDAAERQAQATLTIPLRCPSTWFFTPAPDECPRSDPLQTDGAEEHFERGVMLWSKAEDRIYVLFDDGQQPAWVAYVDEWDEGEPESDPSIVPPPGLYQPVRGFGLVWRERPGVRDRLGWAVDPEWGYPMAIQRTSRPKYNLTYIRALDGGVWELGPEGSSWRHLP